MTSGLYRVREQLTHRPALTGLIIFALGITLRVPFDVIPPANGLYNIDELFPAYAVVDRWLGLPPVTLAWPDMPAEFITFLIFLPKFLWTLLTDRSLDKLSATIVSSYNDPRALIMTLQFMSSCSGALAAVAAYQIAREIANSELAAVTAAVSITLLPLSLQQSLMGTADEIALMFAMWASYSVLGNTARPILAGLMAAATAATKAALGIWLLPVFLAGAIMLYQREGGRSLVAAIARCACAGVIGFTLLYPYLWLEPVRAIKSVLGNVVTHANGTIPDLSVLSLAIPGRLFVIALMVGTLVAGGAAWRSNQRRYPAFALCVLLVGLFVFIIDRGFDYWRYMLGAVIPGISLLALSFTSSWRSATLAKTLFVLMVIFGILAVGQQIEMRRQEVSQPLSKSIEEMCRRGDTIWMWDQVLTARFWPLPMPKATLAEIASYFESANRSHAIGDWLLAAGVSPSAAVALQTDFDERDQIELARWRAIAAISNSSLECPFHLFRYTPGATDSWEPTGYVRGTFTDKSVSDVQSDLDHPGNAAVINVIGPSNILSRLRIQTRPIGMGLSVATKRVAE